MVDWYIDWLTERLTGWLRDWIYQPIFKFWKRHCEPDRCREGQIYANIAVRLCNLGTHLKYAKVWEKQHIKTYNIFVLLLNIKKYYWKQDLNLMFSLVKFYVKQYML